MRMRKHYNCEEEFKRWIEAHFSTLQAYKICRMCHSVDLALVDRGTFEISMFECSESDAVESVLKQYNSLFFELLPDEYLKVLVLYVLFLRQQEKYNELRFSSDICACGKYIMYDYTNVKEFIATKPVICVIGDYEIREESWERVFVQIVENEIQKNNPAISALTSRSLLNNMVVPFFLVDKINGLNCAHLSNGYWININYSTPMLIELIKAFCIYCGYSYSQLHLCGELSVSSGQNEGEELTMVDRKEFDSVTVEEHSEFDPAFYEKYNLIVDAYEGIEVKTLPFSVRVINRLKNNNIITVSDLLMCTPSSLMKIRGFGQNCLDEVEVFCSKLKEKDLIAPSGNNISSTADSLFFEHRDEIAVGDFSAFTDCELSDNEVEMLRKYQDSYEVLGDEHVLLCVNSAERIIPIIEMFADYRNRMKRRIEIWNIVNDLPGKRMENKALGYIYAFTLDEKERSVLKSICVTEDSSLLSMADTDRIDEPSVYILLKSFFKWCSYDLENEISDMFLSIYSKERMRDVIRMRAQKKTLEHIGEILGVTRERVRQIEAKAKKIFSRFYSRIRILSKISADKNGVSVLTPVEIEAYCGIYASDLIYFLQTCENVDYTYDSQLEVFILGEDSISGRVQNSIDTLPDIIKVSRIENILIGISEDIDIPYEVIKRAFQDAYRITGEVYHRHRLTLSTIYERVLNTHYPQGFKAYDADEIRRFREIVSGEYGDVGLPENDRALTSRVASICILCGKGLYRLKKTEYISKQLADKICDYIENSENAIFLTNTLFSVFKEELMAFGIDNKYYLQGVLHELFADKFVFRRDYVSKDVGVTSVYSEVVDFIKKSGFLVSKAQIQAAFPGITEIVINLSVGDSDILNYFGEYLHVSKLDVSDSEKTYLFNVIERLVSDGSAHHGREIHEIIYNEKPEILSRNGAMHAFPTFSIIEYLFKDEFQFFRPYVAKNGIEMERPAEQLHDLIYGSDEFTVTQISEFARDNHFQINSLLDYVNACNDEYLLVDDDILMRIDKTGVDESLAMRVENIILNDINSTVPVKDLRIWSELPSINIPWTEWLIYSIILKWGTKLKAATSSNQLRLSVPLVAPVDKYDPSAYKDMSKGERTEIFVADDLSDMDSLLEQIIGDDFFYEF